MNINPEWLEGNEKLESSLECFGETRAQLPCEICGGPSETMIRDVLEVKPSKLEDGTFCRSWQIAGVHLFCANHERLPLYYMLDGSIQAKFKGENGKMQFRRVSTHKAELMEIRPQKLVVECGEMRIENEGGIGYGTKIFMDGKPYEMPVTSIILSINMEDPVKVVIEQLVQPKESG